MVFIFSESSMENSCIRSSELNNVLEFSYVKDDRNAFEANLKDNEKRRTDISYQLYDLQEVVDEQTVGFYFFNFNLTLFHGPRSIVRQWTISCGP